MKVIMSRKGQIGKLIAIVPIMFLIFIIMGIFVVLSGTFSLTNSGEEDSSNFASEVLSPDDLMFRNLNLDGKTMNVIDAISMYLPKKLDESQGRGRDEFVKFKKSLQSSLESFVEDNRCLFLVQGKKENPSNGATTGEFYIHKKNGEFLFTSAGGLGGGVNKYQDLGLIKGISFFVIDSEGVGANVYVDYYYGRCIE